MDDAGIDKNAFENDDNTEYFGICLLVLRPTHCVPFTLYDS